MDAKEIKLPYPDNSKINRIIYLLKRWMIGIFHLLKLIIKIGPKKFFSMRLYHKKPTGILGLVAIVKDEEPYMEEWINYHRLIGIDKFYIYDNGSTDNLKSTLDPYIDQGIVTYTYFPGEKMQEKAYLDCVTKTKNKIDWLITIDIDEFIQCLDNNNLKNWLEALPLSVSQVELGWMIFGSNNLKDKPEGLVIENFTRHANDKFMSEYKPIVRPEKVVDIVFPHSYQVVGRTIDENKKTIWSYPVFSEKGARPASRNKFRINHYYSKSWEEFLEKSKRGDASVPTREPRGIYNFKYHDQNQILDDSMKIYVPLIKKQFYK